MDDCFVQLEGQKRCWMWQLRYQGHSSQRASSQGVAEEAALRQPFLWQALGSGGFAPPGCGSIPLPGAGRRGAEAHRPLSADGRIRNTAKPPGVVRSILLRDFFPMANGY